MKSQALTHPKTLRLAKLLQLERWGAVGILEMLWQFAATHAPDGNLSRFDAIDLAEAVFWAGDAEKLLEALVACGFVDRHQCCDRHRMVVHDWSDHLQDNVRRRLQRANEGVDYPCNDPRRTADARAAADQCTDGARAPSVQRRSTETRTRAIPHPTPPNRTEPNRVPHPPHADDDKLISVVVGPDGSVSDSDDCVEESDSGSDLGEDRTADLKASGEMFMWLEENLKVPRKDAVDRGLADGKQRSADLTDLKRNIIPALLRSELTPPQWKIIAKECATGQRPIAVFKERLKKLGILKRPERRAC